MRSGQRSQAPPKRGITASEHRWVFKGRSERSERSPAGPAREIIRGHVFIFSRRSILIGWRPLWRSLSLWAVKQSRTPTGTLGAVPGTIPGLFTGRAPPPGRLYPDKAGAARRLSGWIFWQNQPGNTGAGSLFGAVRCLLCRSRGVCMQGNRFSGADFIGRGPRKGFDRAKILV